MFNRALIATVFACMASCLRPAHAQTIRGTLVDSATGAPLTSFAAILLDARGAAVASAWTQEDGRFSLQAPSQGDYTLRIQRLGYRKRSTPVQLAAAQVLELRVAMARIAASLSSVRVTVNARCEQITGDGSGDVSTVWEAARSAFELVAMSAARRDLIVKVLDQTSDSTVRRGDSTVATNVEREGRSLDPYPSLSPDSISRHGYMWASEGLVHYYAPGASILMSDEFLRDHCFHLEGSAAESDRIGIAFEPTGDRHVTEVAGVVWLKRAMSEPASVNFHYTSLPAVRSPEDYGGRAEFVSIPDGGWLLRAWHVHAPVFNVVQRTRYSSSGGMGLGTVSTTRVADSTIAGAHVEGGRILLVRSAKGEVLWADSLGRIAGRVVDSTTHEPIRNVSIALRGSPRNARTDAAGRFTVDSIVPGSYTLVAELQRFGAGALRASMRVRTDASAVDALVTLPLTRATRVAMEELRDGVTQTCSVLREQRERELDAEYRISPNDWVPGSSDSLTVAHAVRQSSVVLQAIVDTSGHTDANSIRILRNGPPAMMREALDAIRAAQSVIEQPQPWCKIRHLLVLPYRVAADRP
jgi:hypothetical protein